MTKGDVNKYAGYWQMYQSHNGAMGYNMIRRTECIICRKESSAKNTKVPVLDEIVLNQIQKELLKLSAYNTIVDVDESKNVVNPTPWYRSWF